MKSHPRVCASERPRVDLPAAEGPSMVIVANLPRPSSAGATTALRAATPASAVLTAPVLGGSIVRDKAPEILA